MPTALPSPFSEVSQVATVAVAQGSMVLATCTEILQSRALLHPSSKTTHYHYHASAPSFASSLRKLSALTSSVLP